MLFRSLEMYQLHHEEVTENLANSSEKRGKRGAISVAKFKIIGDLVWTKEQGVEEYKGIMCRYEIG